jgi:hypothetical protein
LSLFLSNFKRYNTTCIVPSKIRKEQYNSFLLKKKIVFLHLAKKGCKRNEKRKQERIRRKKIGGGMKCVFGKISFLAK